MPPAAHAPQRCRPRVPRGIHAAIVVLAMGVPGTAAGAPAKARAPRAGMRIRATRVADRDIKLDGRVNEPAWRRVPRLPRMMQTAPRYGAKPAHETEVRIAYGRRGLYFAFVCHEHPDHVLGSFARKDDLPPSDRVAIDLDPNHDHTNGFHFTINPSAAQADAQISQDDNYEFLWDGVWDARTARDERGWTAEIFIPWSTLRFEARDVYTFGINVGRWVNETGEETQLAPPPQGIPGRLSYAADYVDVRGIVPGLNFELRPYVSGRIAARRPAGALDQSWRVLPNAGYEAKYGLTGNLTLDMAVNPDFGQAEVDPAVLNLGPFEVFFPERRQFFLESKQTFETGFQLFYSRRVGNNPRPGRAELTTRTVDGEEDPGELVAADPLTRILQAVRVTGEAAPGWQIGALTATTGPTYGVQRFSDGSEQRVGIDPTTQYSVARVRRQFDSQTHFGGIVTSVVRAGDEPEATTGGFDYAVRFRDHWWNRGQIIGTHDGDEAGIGATSELQRRGKNSAFTTGYRLLTPGANYNDLGFMQFAGFVEGGIGVDFFNAQPLGKNGGIRGIGSGHSVETQATFDGHVTRKHLSNHLYVTTKGLWNFSVFGGGHLKRLDPWETRGGIPFEVPLHWWTGGNINTPFNQRVTAGLNVNYGEREGLPGGGGGLELGLRPVDRLQVWLGIDVDTSFGRPRWVSTAADDVPIFGAADLISTNGTLRFTLGITPRLTIQGYNQLLYSTAHHDEFFELTAPDTLVPTNAAPYLGQVDQSLTALISNSILRWEYWPGAFAYLVYTHRTTFDGSSMLVRFNPSRTFTDLGRNAATHEDIVFLKLVHLFAL